MYSKDKSCLNRHFSNKIVMKYFHVHSDYFPDYLIEEECRFKTDLEEAIIKSWKVEQKAAK